MTEIKILLVDDYQLFREGMKSVINSRDDLTVIGEACNGLEAVEKALHLKPDVVVMDINMPVMNGIEATKRIRDLNKEVRILMLTMIDNERFMIDALTNGADSYLNKDAEISEILNTIRKLAKGGHNINNMISDRVLNSVSIAN